MSSKPAPAREQKQVLSFPYEEVGAAGAAAPGGNSHKDAAQREDLARQAGVREGEARTRVWFEAQMAEARKNLAAALDKFAIERRGYFLAAEREIVQLACSITRKILRRESTVDPLLLAGMVRVALEHISQATRVTVRVNPQQVSDFRVFFARNMQERPPDIVEDATLEPDRCVLQTELGVTEVGPEIQLKEIEQGLLDLQAAKPRSNP